MSQYEMTGHYLKYIFPLCLSMSLLENHGQIIYRFDMVYYSCRSICAGLHSSQKSPQDTLLVGSFCAALFSADSVWYRASLEQATGDKVIDMTSLLLSLLAVTIVTDTLYGLWQCRNGISWQHSTTGTKNERTTISSKSIPISDYDIERSCQAFLCTMSSDEHNNFTPLVSSVSVYVDHMISCMHLDVWEIFQFSKEQWCVPG